MTDSAASARSGRPVATVDSTDTRPSKAVGGPGTVHDRAETLRETRGDARSTDSTAPVTTPGMTETIRFWLVERGYNNRDLITLKYAAPEGDRILRRELASQVVDADTVAAARDASPDDLEPVEDSETRKRYAEEVERVASEHDPDDVI